MSQILNSNINGVVPPVFNRAYGQVYNTSDYGAIAPGALVTFDSNGPLLGITHVAGSDTITVVTTGVYLLEWDLVSAGGAGPISLLVNGLKIQQLSWAGDVAGFGLYGVGIIALTAGDIIQLRNDTGVPFFTPTFNAGFVNASITLSTI